MAYARTEYTYVSGAANFDIGFPYLEEEHVEVFVNDVATTSFTFVNDSVTIASPTLVADDVVVIRRRTSPSVQLVDFEGDAVLKEDDLDRAFTQMFYMAQEAMDRANQAATAAGVTAP